MTDLQWFGLGIIAVSLFNLLLLLVEMGYKRDSYRRSIIRFGNTLREQREADKRDGGPL